MGEEGRSEEERGEEEERRRGEKRRREEGEKERRRGGREKEKRRREEGEKERRRRGGREKEGRRRRGGKSCKLFHTEAWRQYASELTYEWLSECSFSCYGRSAGETHSSLPHTAASALMSDRIWTPAQLITATQSHLH